MNSHITDSHQPAQKRQRRSSRIDTEHKDIVEQQKMTMDQFSDDIITHIISFSFLRSCGDYPSERETARLFRTFGRVSKFYQSFCHRYIRQVPICVGEISSIVDFPKVAWMCRNRVKIKEIESTILSTDLQVSCLIHFLSCCDISSLDWLRMKFNESIVKSFDYDKSIAVEAGIPEEFVNKNVGTSVKHAQQLIQQIIGDRARSLCELMISCPAESLHVPLLAGLSDQLCCLELFFTFRREHARSEQTVDLRAERQIHEALSEVIPGMPKLKMLYCEGYLGASIRSKSIEFLELHKSLGLEECNCPSLQTLNLGIDFNTISHTYLSKFSHRIKKLRIYNEELEIRVLNQAVDHDADESKTQRLRRLSQIIENMPFLENLRVVEGDFPLTIRSNTLKRINTSHCDHGFIIPECFCPALESLKCSYFPDFHVAHIEPVDHRSFYGSKKTIRMKASDYTYSGFVGFKAPESCNLHFVPIMGILN